MKGPASSVATFLNWTFAFIVVLTFVDVKAGLTDAGAFWFYAGICFVGTLFCFFFVPETAGKTPQQIQVPPLSFSLVFQVFLRCPVEARKRTFSFSVLKRISSLRARRLLFSVLFCTS